MNLSTPGLPVHHQLLELAQTLVHESVTPKQVCFSRHPGPTFPIFGDKCVLLPPGAGVHFHMSDFFLSERQKGESECPSCTGAMSLFLLCCVFFALHGLSLVAVSRGYSSCGAWASSCSGFSCCRAQAQGRVGFTVVAHGLSCPRACGIFPDQGLNLCPLH